MSRFTTIRIAILLGILIVVGFTSAHQRVYTRNWSQPLGAIIYPINADGNPATDTFIGELKDRNFASINKWGEREAARYDLDLHKPFNVTLGEQLHVLPPTFPENQNALSVLWWGLRFRWWAFQNTPDSHEGITQVRLFVIYHDASEVKVLAHSLGMEKGLMGLVHVFADRRYDPQNNIVITHELLHTVGATDKYQPSGQPVFPEGYANSDRKPLHPQRHAEVMTGRIPLSPSDHKMAESLKSVQINPYTAREINWIQ